MIFTKIVITNCHEKLRKLSLIFLRKIQIMTDIWKIIETSHFWNIEVALLKFKIPIACGLIFFWKFERILKSQTPRMNLEPRSQKIPIILKIYLTFSRELKTIGVWKPFLLSKMSKMEKNVELFYKKCNKFSTV